MKLLAGVAVLLAIGAGLGTYFGLRGSSVPEVPKAHKDPILEQATREGIIHGYRAVRHQWGVYSYHAIGSDVAIEYPNACGERSCPGGSTPILWIEYGRGSNTLAHRLLGLAQNSWPGKIKLFEVTYVNTHIPDARIMLIPKAGA